MVTRTSKMDQRDDYDERRPRDWVWVPSLTQLTLMLALSIFLGVCFFGYVARSHRALNEPPLAEFVERWNDGTIHEQADD